MELTVVKFLVKAGLKVVDDDSCWKISNKYDQERWVLKGHLNQHLKDVINDLIDRGGEESSDNTKPSCCI